MLGLGVMSGSSLDGIDAILVNFEEEAYSILEKESIPLSEAMKIRLRESASLTLKEYLILESDYSVFLAEKIKERFTQTYDYISVHGHTTHHLPETKVTNQMVNGGILSALTNRKVITDFRSGDIALGGTGAPMIPMVEKTLFKGFDYYLNLGGIANITMAKDWTAYDVCPCNQLHNYIAQKGGKEYDEDGNMARTGSLDRELFEQLGAFPFYRQVPPKAIDNNWIRSQYFPILENQTDSKSVLHTISQWIATEIIRQIPDSGTLFITGGGAHNSFLVDCIKTEAVKTKVEVIIPNKEIIDFKEAILMAYLGYLRINVKETMMSSVTGAEKNSIGGAIYNVHGT